MQKIAGIDITVGDQAGGFIAARMQHFGEGDKSAVEPAVRIGITTVRNGIQTGKQRGMRRHGPRGGTDSLLIKCAFSGKFIQPGREFSRVTITAEAVRAGGVENDQYHVG